MADKELYQTAEQVLASKAVKKDEKEKKVNEERKRARKIPRRTKEKTSRNTRKIAKRLVRGKGKVLMLTHNNF